MENCAATTTTAAVDKCDHQENIRDENCWSESECCHLAYELHHLHHQQDS
jgi:hypothetical protein